MSGQRRRLLADEENAVKYICQWVYIVGKAMKRAKEKKGPIKGRWHTHCLLQTFFEYTSEWMRRGLFFYINDAIHILFRTKNTGIATQLNLKNKEYCWYAWWWWTRM